MNELLDKVLDNLIVLDTETTGLNPSSDEILQLSIINGHGEVLFDGLLKPEYVTSWEAAQAVNGITPEKVKHCLRLRDVYPKIKKILGSYRIILGYNVDFDLAFLHDYVFGECQQIVDVMTVFSEIYGEWNDYWGNYKWQKLTKCADYYGYKWDEESAHNSLGDCKATLFCFKKMLEEGHFHNVLESLSSILENPTSVCPGCKCNCRIL